MEIWNSYCHFKSPVFLFLYLMKKITITFFLVLVCSVILSAQQDSLHIYQSKYEKSITLTGSSRPFKSDYEYTKFIELEKSIFSKVTKTPNTNTSEMSEDDDAIFFYTSSGKNTNTVYKDYNENSFFAKHQLTSRYFLVKEDLDVFDWEISDTTKDILGYSCQLATTKYRGRTFKAWFTSDLPIGGPYKYDGLPGMILEIESTDGFIKFEAYGIKNSAVVQGENEIENPFKSKDAYSWEDFSALYKKKALELINYRPSENALGTTISRCAIECYIKEDDKEYNEAIASQQKKISRYKN